MTGKAIEMPTNNILTYGSASLGYGVALLAQAAPPGLETVGLSGAIIGTVALAVRTAGELGKLWIAYRETALRADDMKLEISELKIEVAELKAKLARAQRFDGPDAHT